MWGRLNRAGQDLVTMRSLFTAAELVAHAEGVHEPAAEHLLLAAMDLPDGQARAVLAGWSVGPREVGDALRAQHAEALASVGVDPDDSTIQAHLPEGRAGSGAYRSAGSLQALFQRSVELAREAGQPLTSGHVLLAAAELDLGTLPRTFRQLGIDRQALAIGARDAIGEADRD